MSLPQIGRRGFIGALLGGVAAAVATPLLAKASAITNAMELDPEKALWIPGAKTFFIPKQPALYAGKAIRAASDSEIAALTGDHFVRLKFRSYNPMTNRVDHNCIVVSEKNFNGDATRYMLAGAREMEAHFDDGTVAYNIPNMERDLEQIRAIAHVGRIHNAARKAELTPVTRTVTLGGNKWEV